MSSFREKKITCPECQQEGPYTVWDSVNVNLDPELREKVLDGSIFEWTCPGCGKTFQAPYTLIYHDMTHNFMLLFEPNKTHIIPFAEYVRIKENELDERIIHKIAEEYRNCHPRENILFECLTEDKSQLVFSIYTMPDKYWMPTERKHLLAFEEYKTRQTS